MNTVMAKANSAAPTPDSPKVDLEKECETWDWARTAGVSQPDLRKALRDSLNGDAAA